MIPELGLFKLLLKHDTYKKSGSLISVDRYQKPELFVLFNTLKVYFAKYPRDTTLDEYSAFFFNNYPRLKPDEIKAYESLFAAIKDSTVSDEQAQDLLQTITDRQTAVQIADRCLAFSEGAVDRETLSQEFNKFGASKVLQPEVTFVTDDLNEILEQTVLKPGLRWRLPSLNRSLGSLRKGDFGFVFARPETGKTTFLASEVTHFASQAQGPIIWFNNEEQGQKVKLRCYQAALGAPLEYLIANREAASRRYSEITSNHIKLVDSGSLFRSEVESVIESCGTPGLIVFDQIDKIRGFDEDRNDLVMGAIYQWAREIAKRYCPVIGVCQADGSGDGQKWLTMNNVAEAKTAKQGEADWILGIGRTYDENLQYVRHFHLSKNKLQGDQDSDPAWRHGRWDTLIQPELARYRDLGE